MKFDLNSGAVRAGIVFAIAYLSLWILFFLLGTVGIDFFGETFLILLGSGWAAYWIWKKTEVGRY